MRISAALRGLVLLGAILLGSCHPGESLLPAGDADPGPLTAQPIDMHSIEVRWAKVSGARTYELERRANLEGPFERIATIRNLTSYVDRDLSPNTIYGYRLLALNDLGQDLGFSPVTGARTPPLPSIQVSTSSILGGDPELSVDSTGYRVRIKGGSVEQTLPIEGTGTQLFVPLPPGIYTVSLEDVADQCELTDGTSSRSVAVTDQGVNTLATVAFKLSCRDRSRGRLKASITAAGDTTDPNGFRVVLSGVASDAGLPPSERAIVIARQAGPAGGTLQFDNLRPGTYSLLIEDVSPACSVDGAMQRDGLAVAPLSDLAQAFAVTCARPDQTGGNRPFTLRTVWSRDTAANGTTVTATTTLDIRQSATRDVAAFQFTLRTPGAASIVRLERVEAASTGWSLTSNTTTPGQFVAVATNPNGVKGLVSLVTATYTVIGANGDQARTQISDLVLDGTSVSGYQDEVQVIPDTLVVGAGGSSSSNQAPVAAANGPYTGAAGQPVAFTSVGSTDPDGSIINYAWSFGDGQSGTGASPTHTYAAAGSYTATLTVTDNLGATASSPAAVAISGSGPPPTTPLLLKLSFGTFNPATQTVPLDISLDLTTDLPETPSVEQIQSWVLDSLKWNKSVLQYSSFVRGSGTGITNFIEALSRGVLRLTGTPAPGQSTGLVHIGTVNFIRIGSPGTSTTTATTTGPITGTPGTGSYAYQPRIRIEEATYTVPSNGPAPTTVSGTVSSPQLGALGAVTVSVGGGLTGTTAGNGSYSIVNVPAGSYSATVAGLPAGCTAPAAVPVTVAAAPVTGVNFVVTCPAPTGVVVSGTVSSPQRGLLSGITVSLGAGLVATTAGNGAFAMVNVAPGTYSATVSGIPAGCTTPAAIPVTVASVAVSGVNFSVTCPTAPTTGTLNGSISFTAGSPTPSLTGVTVTIAPSSGPSLTTNPSVAGAWTKAGVPAGSGTVTISSLPTGCTTTAASAPYSGLTGGGALTVPAFSVTCTAAPANQYPVAVTWSAVTAGQATMTVTIDMGAFNDPKNHGTGADKIGGFQVTWQFPTARLSGVTCAAQSGFTGPINTLIPGAVTLVLTNLSGASGLVTLHTCTFTVAGAGPTVLTWDGLLGFDDTGAVDFTSKMQVVMTPLP